MNQNYLKFNINYLNSKKKIIIIKQISRILLIIIRIVINYKFLVYFKIERMHLIIPIILSILVTHIKSYSLEIQPDNLTVNIINPYKFTFTFNNTNLRNVTIIFPSTQHLSNGSFSIRANSVLLAPSQYLITSSNKTITIYNQTPASGTFTLVFNITNIKNPHSVIPSQFSAQITPTDGVNPTVPVYYQAGTLASCIWKFDGFTGASNSFVIINAVIATYLQAGTNKIVIQYPSNYEDTGSTLKKFLNPTAANSVVTYSIDNGNYNPATASITNPIQFSISWPSVINSSGLISIKITNIINPPTQNPSGQGFKIFTADSSGWIIDSITKCSIDPIKVLEIPATFFMSPPLKVGDTYTTPQILVTTSIPFSIQINDILEIESSQALTVTSTAALSVRFRRKTIVGFNLDTNYSQTGTSRFFRSNVLDDGESNSTMNFQFQFNIKMPPSQKPWEFVLWLRRSNRNFVKFRATLSASAISKTSSLVTLTSNSTQMATQTKYILSVTLQKPLAKTGRIVLGFNSQYSLVSGECKAYNGTNQITSNSMCTVNGSSSLIYRIGQNSTATFDAGSVINIQYPALITNPIYPRTYTFKLYIYYFQTDDSLVQYASSFGSLTTTTYNTLNVLLATNDYVVYSETTVSINYTNKVFIPSGSTIQFDFPSQVYTLKYQGKIFIDNVQITNCTVSPIDTVNKIIKITIAQDVAPNIKWTIPILATVPPIEGYYSSIQMKITRAGVTYQQSSTGLQMRVSYPSVKLTTTITPKSTTTVVNYDTAIHTISLKSQVPLPATFFVYLTVPIQIGIGSSYNCISLHSKSTCSGSNITRLTSKQLKITIQSNWTLQDTQQQFLFDISDIINPRYAGPTSTWNIQLKAINNGAQARISENTTFSTGYTVKTNGLSCLLDQTMDYYKANTDNVLITCNFSNDLTQGDYIQFMFTLYSYKLVSNTSFMCPNSTLYTCNLSNASTATTLYINVFISTTPLANTKQLSLQFIGLVSYESTTYYADPIPITVKRFSKNGYSIDDGVFYYDINCNKNQIPNISSKQCKTCRNGICNFCYTGMYKYNNDSCLSNCPVQTQYSTFSNNGSFVCQACISPCLTCQSSTKCIRCVNTSNYYLLTSTSTCIFSTQCNTSSSYWVNTINDPLQIYCDSCLAECKRCVNNSYNGCLECQSVNGTQYILENGVCKTNCTILKSFIYNGECIACDPACASCNGTGPNKCTACQAGYVKDGVTCVSSCPSDKFKVNNMYCGCEGLCSTCTSFSSTYCQTCLNTSLYILDGNCLAQCPIYTYPFVNRCIKCPSNCIQCIVQTSCIKCATGYYIYESRCYSDCNTISLQYDISGSNCVLCPSGCDTCTGTICSTCLQEFTKVGDGCTKTCSLTNSCTVPSQVPDSILTIPGTLSCIIWLLIVFGVKFFVPKLYLPYSLLFIPALVEFFIIISTTIYSNQLSLQTARRLLTVDPSYRPTIFSLLVVALVINYLSNIAFAYIFYKYIIPIMKKPRQVDYITVGFAVIIGFLTNYRFSLIVFSKMFPKPHIQIQLASYLTPIHYLCTASILFSGISMAAGGLIIKNEYPLTDIFMLGIDIIILELLLIGLTIWMISCDKPKQYFQSQIKKYETQQTLQGEKDDKKDDKNRSSLKLMFEDSQIEKQGNRQILQDSVQFDKRLLDRLSTINMTKDYIPESDNQKPLSSKFTKNNNKVEFSGVKLNSNNKIANSMDITDISALIEKTPKNKDNRDGIPVKKVKQNVIDYKKNQESPSNQKPKYQTEEEDDNMPKTLQRNQTKNNILADVHEPSSDQIPSLPLRDSVRGQKSEMGNANKPKKQLNKANNQKSQIIKGKNPMKKHHPKKQVDLNDKTLVKTNMKKKNKFFQSQAQIPERDINDNDFQIQQLDLDSIIRSKIIVIGQKQKSMDNNTSFNNISLVQKKEEQNSQANQQISPSWFNIQNQRFEFSSQDSDFSEN